MTNFIRELYISRAEWDGESSETAEKAFEAFKSGIVSLSVAKEAQLVLEAAVCSYGVAQHEGGFYDGFKCAMQLMLQAGGGVPFSE